MDESDEGHMMMGGNGIHLHIPRFPDVRNDGTHGRHGR